MISSRASFCWMPPGCVDCRAFSVACCCSFWHHPHFTGSAFLFHCTFAANFNWFQMSTVATFFVHSTKSCSKHFQVTELWAENAKHLFQQCCKCRLQLNQLFLSMSLVQHWKIFAHKIQNKSTMFTAQNATIHFHFLLEQVDKLTTQLQFTFAMFCVTLHISIVSTTVPDFSFNSGSKVNSTKQVVLSTIARNSKVKTHSFAFPHAIKTPNMLDHWKFVCVWCNFCDCLCTCCMLCVLPFVQLKLCSMFKYGIWISDETFYKMVMQKRPFNTGLILASHLKAFESLIHLNLFEFFEIEKSLPACFDKTDPMHNSNPKKSEMQCFDLSLNYIPQCECIMQRSFLKGRHQAALSQYAICVQWSFGKIKCQNFFKCSHQKNTQMSTMES